jgi:large subunit ribosomal protein L18
MTTISKHSKRQSRHKRIRARAKGTEERPRLAVFKSNRFIYAQIINDDTAKTLAHSTGMKLKVTGVKAAEVIGKDIAEKAKTAGVTKVVFDRGGFNYTGVIKALAEAARANGLDF